MVNKRAGWRKRYAMSLSLIPQAANGFSSADGPYTDGTD
jgi:hypothetical protein